MNTTTLNVHVTTVAVADNITKAEAQLNVSGIPATISFNFIVTVLAICGNIVTVSVLPRWGGLSYNTKILIANLTLSNTMTSVTAIFRRIWPGYLSRMECLLLNCFLCSFLMADLGFVSIISIRNMLAVIKPMATVTSWKMHLISAANWVFFLLFNITGVLSATPGNVFTSKCFLGNAFYHLIFMKTFFFLISVSFILMIVIQMKTVLVISKLSSCIVPAQGHAISGNSHELSSAIPPPLMGQRFRRIVSMNYIIMIVLFIELLSYLPYLTMLSMHLFAHSMVQETHLRLTAGFVMMNSVSNIFVYARRSKEFRQAFRNTFTCFF